MNEFKATEKWYKDAAESETGIDEISAGDSLRSCPFCNGEASISMGKQSTPFMGKMIERTMYYVECLKCASASDMTSKPETSVILWNTRV